MTGEKKLTAFPEKGHFYAHGGTDVEWCVKCGVLKRTVRSEVSRWFTWHIPGATNMREMVHRIVPGEPPCAVAIGQRHSAAILALAQLALLGRTGSTVEVVRARLAELGLQLPEKGAK